MKKKHKGYKPQARQRLKKTTGKREFVDVIYMEKERIDGVTNIYATCTCGNWRSSREADTINKVGLEAKAHAEASEGKCRLRRHREVLSDSEAAPDPLSEEAVQ